MPPKKQGKAKNQAKARTPTLINGLTKEEMSKEQLEEHIAHLREELDREREERNYFQLEKDNIHTFWKITVRKLEEVEAELKNMDKSIEDDEGLHQVEVQVYKQKMKHLLCEHQNTFCELKAYGLVIAEVLQKEQDLLETELCNKMRAIRKATQELDNENCSRELELKHDEEMTTTRNNHERRLTEVTAMNEKMQLMQQQMENMTKSVITEREFVWDHHISELRKDHNKIISDLNTTVFYLKEEEKLINKEEEKIAEKNGELLEMKKKWQAVSQDCQRLSELVSTIKGEIAYAEKKTLSYSVIKDASERAKLKAFKDLRLEHEALEKIFSELQLEKDKLYKSYNQKIEKMHHEANLECVALEKKHQALTDSLEKIQSQLDAVLSAPNVDHTALRGIINKVEVDLESRNAAIKNLKFKRNVKAKARGDMVLAVEAKEGALCVPVQQLVQ
ncbi:dynein regulatory complex subunit 4 [Melanotaenia boesemani]|uniref:dynein regulatory complex subunit 4 n=1 Tax=Melanotaenia boesemani TaxID=1250792 RepID=UPI001C058BCF|nr:dynein regulatory complex subunit 4 [Melanotaenia boesemani]